MSSPGDHWILGIDGTLANARARVRVDITYHHETVCIADIPELRIREAIETDATLKTGRIQIVQIDHSRDSRAMALGMAKQESS